MRIFVFFDLPVVTYADRKEYVRFRKFLIKSGFLMEQESVYCKLAPNSTVAALIIENIRKNRPPKGLVEVLRITEKQYSNIEIIVGERKSEVVDSDDRLLIL